MTLMYADKVDVIVREIGIVFIGANGDLLWEMASKKYVRSYHEDHQLVWRMGKNSESHRDHQSRC